MRRRSFLTQTSLASLGAMINGIPVRAMGMESPLIQALMGSATDTDHVLVLVQLNGGNDGLNMVIPLENYGAYNAARANVAIAENRVLRLDGHDKCGLHPSMTGIQQLYNEGKAAIVNAVGYPNPNFSHFRATDIWMTGADSNQYLTSGWVGRYLDEEFPGFPTGYPNNNMPDPLGIQIGSVTSVAFQGLQATMGMSISDPVNFYNLINGIQDPAPNTPAGFELNYIRTVARQSQQYAEVIKNAALSVTQQGTYPTQNSLADQLKIVARLIKGGLRTRVYMVSIGGFDTHASQVVQSDTTTGTHANLMRLLSDAVKAFMDDLKFLGVQRRVMGMTFSEFGRRIKSNSSMGTDHGAAAPLIVFGEYADRRVLGDNPSIPGNVSVNDNIPMQYDFRSVYATMLEKWFCADSNTLQTVLLRNYQSLPIVKTNSCHSAYPDLSESVLVKNYPNPFVSTTTITFMTNGGHTLLTVMDTLGRVIRVLVDEEFAGAGQHNVSFNAERFPVGVYYARLQNGPVQQVRAMLKVR